MPAKKYPHRIALPPCELHCLPVHCYTHRMNKTIIWVLGIIIVVGVIILVAVKPSAPADTGSTVPPPPPPPATQTPPVASATVIKMTDAGFQPSEVTVKKGDAVELKNEGTKDHWPASAIHPTHLVYPEFDPKQGIKPGESWSFTFDKIGEWRFHDHLFPTSTGKVTVTE